MPHKRIAMILVENLDPLLRQRSGPKMHITGEYDEAVRRARLGEKRGKWRVLSGIEGMQYENREMTASDGSAYLTKDGFVLAEDLDAPRTRSVDKDPPGKDVLTHEDVFGKKDSGA